ncbi:MAG: hypothetical protein ACT4PS_12855 [Betaproteobacteria bacterium]
MSIPRSCVRQRALLVTLLVCMSCGALGAESGWPPGSAMAVGAEYVKERDRYARLVERKQAELTDVVSKAASFESGGKQYTDRRLVNAIESLHKAWRSYFVHECELIGALSGAGGTWPSTYAVRCEANLMYRRYRRLNHAIRCIDRIAPEERRFEAAGCLYQLSPLTYGKES